MNPNTGEIVEYPASAPTPKTDDGKDFLPLDKFTPREVEALKTLSARKRLQLFVSFARQGNKQGQLALVRQKLADILASNRSGLGDYRRDRKKKRKAAKASKRKNR
jgi:hypothetical protein